MRPMARQAQLHSTAARRSIAPRNHNATASRRGKPWRLLRGESCSSLGLARRWFVGVFFLPVVLVVFIGMISGRHRVARDHEWTPAPRQGIIEAIAPY
jgi:hypothetical protein